MKIVPKKEQGDRKRNIFIQKRNNAGTIKGHLLFCADITVKVEKEPFDSADKVQISKTIILGENQMRFINIIRGNIILEKLLTYIPLLIILFMPDELTPISIAILLILMYFMVYFSNYLFVNPIKKGFMLSLICLAIIVIFFLVIITFFNFDLTIVLILTALVAFGSSILIKG